MLAGKALPTIALNRLDRMSQDISIYLLKSKFNKLDTAFPISKVGDGNYAELTIRDPSAPSGTAFKAYLKSTSSPEPSWLSWLEELFDIGPQRPVATVTSAVILVQAGKRIFAVCFGYGWQALAADSYVQDFGLRVALSHLDPVQLRTLNTRSISLNSRQRLTHQSIGSQIANFAIDVDAEWLRNASGKSQSIKCGSIHGGKAIRLRSWGAKLSELVSHCSDFYQEYLKPVPPEFDFYENIKPLDDADPLIPKLEKALVQALDQNKTSTYAVDVDGAIYEAASSFVVKSGRENVSISDLDNDQIADAIRKLKKTHSTFDIEKVRVSLLDSSGKELETERLVDCVNFEHKIGTKNYLRLDRKWFTVSDSYVKKIDEKIRRINDATSALKPPIWDKGTQTKHGKQKDEDAYNRHFAKQSGWLLQDKQFYQVGRSKIEPCDLLSDSHCFIHVKSGSNSSNISHLTTQALASAELYAQDATYRAAIEARLLSHWPTLPVPLTTRANIVLAIGRKGTGPLLGNMLISKISVSECARRISALGFDVSLCRITMT